MLTEYLFYGVVYYIAGLVIAVAWRILPESDGAPSTPKPIYAWFLIMTFWPLLVGAFILLGIFVGLEKLLKYEI